MQVSNGYYSGWLEVHLHKEGDERPYDDWRAKDNHDYLVESPYVYEPDNRKKNNRITIIVGLPGSGKSYLIQCLKTDDNVIFDDVLQKDGVFRMLNTPRYVHYIH